MSELELLKKELSEAKGEIESLRKELNEADEIACTEIQSANRWNFWLTGVIVFLVMWIGTS